MKKRMTALLAVVGCFLSLITGCAKDNTSDLLQSGGGKAPVEISLPYTASDLETLYFTHEGQNLTVEVSDNQVLRNLLLTLTYYDRAPAGASGTELQYSLSMLSGKLECYEGGKVCFLPEDTNGAKVTAYIQKGGLSYLDTLVSGGAFSLEGYTLAETIKVFNAKNQEGKITDKPAFLADLQPIRLVKLSNLSDYSLGELSYTIKFDENELKVYQKFVLLGGELYAICEGDFEFLKQIQFSSSSGWLPWI